MRMLIAWMGVVAVLVVAYVEAAQTPTPPARTVAVAVSEIVALRTRNAQLEAMLIDRDKQIANLKYELGKRLLETQADLDEARLNKRAEGVYERLKELLKPGPDAKLDWATGRFIHPPKAEGEKKQ